MSGPPVPRAFVGPAADGGPGLAGLPGPAEAWLPRPYPQLLRGPTHRWWRPVVSALVMAAWFVVTLGAAGVTLELYSTAGDAPRWLDSSSVDPSSNASITAWSVTPAGLAWTNLLIAGLIIGAQFAVWAGFGWRPRWVASVAGGVRWWWLVRCYLVVALVIGAVTAALVVLGGGLGYRPADGALASVVVILLTTPLQAAGEEYFFRGWLTQAVGSLVPRARAGAVLAALVSSTVFAFAHGQQDLWLFADRFGYGLVASWLVWRTGGLEASIAVHTVLNLLAFGLAIATGQVAEMVNETAGTPQAAAMDIGLIVVTAVLLDLLARRSRVVRVFRPPIRAW